VGGRRRGRMRKGRSFGGIDSYCRSSMCCLSSSRCLRWLLLRFV
jgi:hypothetical protein